MVAMRKEQNDRLNMLLTDRGQRWADQLPQLLQPQGVRTLRADCVNTAVRIMRSDPIHMAVIDMALPTDSAQAASTSGTAGGLRLLQEIQRLHQRPKAIVAVRDRSFDARIDGPMLIEAMQLGVFSVLDQPVDLEQILSVLSRALERYFNGLWPKTDNPD